MFPSGRLYTGETDGSSFPNGGLRATHTAAAFTSWDRSSPCFVYDKVLRIPCAFVTHYGRAIDDKTPLLRSQDAVAREGLRLLKACGVEKEATTMYAYLGWEQEFFVVSAELYKKRPDLVNAGRTLFGRLPPRHQSGDLNYFGATPGPVEELLIAVQTEMMRMGSPMVRAVWKSTSEAWGEVSRAGRPPQRGGPRPARDVAHLLRGQRVLRLERAVHGSLCEGR